MDSVKCITFIKY